MIARGKPATGPDTAAIVVAGGQGKRFGGKVRKQYLSLCGRPLVWWSLHAFDQSPSIGALVLVLPKEDMQAVRRQLTRWKVVKPLRLVTGGRTRADSVRQGLNAVPTSFQWVSVHDAVRPLVTPELIEKVLRETRRYRAAIAACPSKDTIKVATPRQMIQRTIPRETVWNAQTPQAFERRLLERAHRRGSKGATDDSLLVERLGVRVKLVASPADNLKVTVPSDLQIAQRLMKAR